jgi:hypothetical protein
VPCGNDLLGVGRSLALSTGALGLLRGSRGSALLRSAVRAHPPLIMGPIDTVMELRAPNARTIAERLEQTTGSITLSWAPSLASL